MNFKKWLIAQESGIHEAWSDYNPFKTQQFNPQRRQFLQKGALTAGGLALSTLGGNVQKINWEAMPEQNEVDQTIMAIYNDSRFKEHLAKNNTTLTRKDVRIIKPSEILGKGWGEDNFEKVKQSIASAQSNKKQKFGDIEVDMPFMPDSSIPLLKKIDDPVMVFFSDPLNFGQYAEGFSAKVALPYGQRKNIVVIKPNSDEHVLRHELRHAMQNLLQDENFSSKSSSKLQKYLQDYQELGVRLAEMRMQYFKQTKILVQDDPEQVRLMLKHFLQNQKSYSLDVQQIESVIRDLSSRGKLEEFLNWIIKNMPYYVRKMNANTGLGMA